MFREWAACSLLSLLAVGCGGTPQTYPVEGVVTLPEGTPAANCRVVFDNRRQTAQGVTDAQGRYRLTTFVSGDGAVPGAYEILVAELQDLDPDAPVAARFDARYQNFQTSGLTFVVEPKSNTCNLRLAAATGDAP